MPPITTINIVQGDYGYNLNFTLQDNSGAAINLTGAALTLKVQQWGQDVVKFTGNMVVDVAASGTCHYVVASTDFDQEGKYKAEIVVNYGSGTEILSYANIVIVATPKLPAA